MHSFHFVCIMGSSLDEMMQELKANKLILVKNKLKISNAVSLLIWHVLGKSMLKFATSCIVSLSIYSWFSLDEMMQEL